MAQDTILNGTRFGFLLRREWILNKRSYGLKAVALLAIWLCMLFAALYGKYALMSYAPDFVQQVWSEQVARFPFVLIFTGILAGSSFMDAMQTKGQRVAALMLPVTPFEKFALKWLLTVPVFIWVLFATFLVASFLTTSLLGMLFPAAPWVGLPPVWSLWLNDFGSSTIVCFSMGYLFVQSLFMLGSVIWPRRSFVNTLAALLSLASAFSLLWALLYSFLPEEDFSVWWYADTPFFLTSTFGSVALALGTCFNWAVAYLRLKEFELVDRW